MLGLACSPWFNTKPLYLTEGQRETSLFCLFVKGTSLNVSVAVLWVFLIFSYFLSVREGHDIVFCPVEMLNKNKATFIFISSSSEYQRNVH